MKTHKIKTYSAKELKQKNPKGFERALDDYRNSNDVIFWSDEIVESLKACIKATDGIRLRDWSIDAFGCSWIRLEWSNDDAKDLTGARAQAWIENNLLSNLRIGFKSAERWRLSQYGKYYRAGMIKPCPFTGVCFDDDYLQSLQKSIKAGGTLSDAFDELASVAGKLIQAEWEDQNSEEYFLDYAEANEYEFTLEGKRF